MPSTFVDLCQSESDAEKENGLINLSEDVGIKKSGTVFTVEGVSVRFPFEPYPSQRQLVESMIRAFNRSNGKGPSPHGLLESPTGSGKSLAILCGALAWLEHQKEEARKGNLANLPLSYSCSCENNMTKPECDDEDFVPLSVGKSPEAKAEEGRNLVVTPRIYICSRTHKQISQLVRELKKTTYKPSYTVLASRTHYCINAAVIEDKQDINEACKLALKDNACSYARNLQQRVQTRGHLSMDVEDLVKYGKTNRSCPYFLARDAASMVHLVFAPYSYLIDPVIRQAMGINLGNSIVIIDEAHNIEDACRDAGSFEVTLDSLYAISQELNGILHESLQPNNVVVLPEAHRVMSHAISVWHNWVLNRPPLSNPSNASNAPFESSCDMYSHYLQTPNFGRWKEDEIIKELQNIGVIPSTVTRWTKQLTEILDKSAELSSRGSTLKRKDNRKSDELTDVVLSFGSCRVLQGLFLALQNVLEETKRYLSAYRLVRTKSVTSFRGQRRVEIILGFWCLSPDVTFAPLANSCRSVILTSGTLSPMHTFASELKTPFGERLEALHVIDPSQVWVGVVPAGPGGLGMIGNYKTMESFDYQDELAQAILRVVTIVPFGVLCFMPSYASLDRLLQRMKQKGVYDSISSIKTVMVEPKQGTAKDFDAFMAKYYGCIQEAKRNRGMSKITGALLFAVYRGKISEGLDLADENARAVIPVGIPYPSYLDQKVIQKREYNDRFSHTKRLLTGQQWYEIQAFRTLNQALGRCIRHRHDWGAIFLVEQRFATSPRTCAQLSRWVRSSVRVFDAFETAIGELNKFISMNHSSKNNGKY